MSYIYSVLGWILNLFYHLVNNYGFAVILFTVFVKLALLPLDLKQRKSMARTQKIQPLLNEVQKKYANDKDKLSQETMKIYQKYGINPMGGCLPMLIQFPIIIGLWWAVKKPIIYMMGIDEADVWRIAEAVNAWAETHPEAITGFGKGAFPLTYSSSNTSNTFGTYEIQIAQLINNNQAILEQPGIADWAASTGLKDKLINFSFFGLDLSAVPDFGALLSAFSDFSKFTLDRILLWMIPILSGLSSFVSSKITMAQNNSAEKKDKNVILSEEEKKASSTGNSSGETMKTMSMIMPLFSAWFAFTLPAAVGLYWIISNIIQMLQHICVTKLFVTDISVEEIEGEIENVRKGRKNRKKSR